MYNTIRQRRLPTLNQRLMSAPYFLQGKALTNAFTTRPLADSLDKPGVFCRYRYTTTEISLTDALRGVQNRLLSSVIPGPSVYAS